MRRSGEKFVTHSCEIKTCLHIVAALNGNIEISIIPRICGVTDAASGVLFKLYELQYAVLLAVLQHSVFSDRVIELIELFNALAVKAASCNLCKSHVFAIESR